MNYYYASGMSGMKAKTYVLYLETAVPALLTSGICIVGVAITSYLFADVIQMTRTKGAMPQIRLRSSVSLEEKGRTIEYKKDESIEELLAALSKVLSAYKGQHRNAPIAVAEQPTL